MTELDPKSSQAELNQFKFPVDKTAYSEECQEIALRLLGGLSTKDLREANTRTRERTIQAALLWAEDFLKLVGGAKVPGDLSHG